MPTAHNRPLERAPGTYCEICGSPLLLKETQLIGNHCIICHEVIQEIRLETQNLDAWQPLPQGATFAWLALMSLASTMLFASLIYEACRLLSP